MSMRHDNTASYPNQYANVFAPHHTPAYRSCVEMRDILKQLMAAAADDAYSLERKSTVPQPTTQRFLSGRHGEPRASTVKKWAAAYEISESQLRGDLPLPEDIWRRLANLPGTDEESPTPASTIAQPAAPENYLSRKTPDPLRNPEVSRALFDLARELERGNLNDEARKLLTAELQAKTRFVREALERMKKNER